MTSSLVHVASRLFNTPLMVHPGKARAIVDALGARVLGSEFEIDGPEAVAHIAFTQTSESMGRLGDPLGRRYQKDGRDSFARIDNVAVIPVEGSLIHKGRWVGANSGDTSYEGIQAQVRQALADSSVRGVVFELDSFGGEVAGAFETAALIRDLSAAKPTMAILTDFALSAGYLLASGARQIVMPALGRAGSIGVITMHVDYSGMLEKKGMKVTVLSAGEHKAEGSPYEPLPAEVAQSIRAELAQARELFAEAVAEGRGKRFDKAAALSTEADDFRGEEAVGLGLADAVGRSDEAFDAFVAEINAATRLSFGGYSMTTAAEAAALAAATKDHAAATIEPVVHLAEHQAAVTKASADGRSAGKAEGLKEGGAAERARISAIVTSEHAKGRESLAQHFAYATDMAPEHAIEALKAAPAVSAAAPAAPAVATLDAEMKKDAQPPIGGQGGPRADSLSDFEKGAAEMAVSLGKPLRK